MSGLVQGLGFSPVSPWVEDYTFGYEEMWVLAPQRDGPQLEDAGQGYRNI